MKHAHRSTSSTTPRPGPGRRNGLACGTVLTTVVTMIAAMLVSGGGAQATPSEGSSQRVVASSPQGELSSRIVGETAGGDRVTGSFVPLDFSRKNGTLKVRGLLQGVVHPVGGQNSTFSALRTMRVAAINGTRLGGAAPTASRAACDILHLRLAPLDLDLLGLQVHLNRVVLDIVAQSGAGNLLGNLLCAVTGLLDGGLGGLLGRLTSLLDDILAALRLGV